MAIQSYNNLYLPNLSENLGVMFEHAVDIGINPTIFGIHLLIPMLQNKLKRKSKVSYLLCIRLFE